MANPMKAMIIQRGNRMSYIVGAISLALYDDVVFIVQKGGCKALCCINLCAKRQLCGQCFGFFAFVTPHIHSLLHLTCPSCPDRAFQWQTTLMSNSESGTSLPLPPEWTLTSSLHIA